MLCFGMFAFPIRTLISFRLAFMKSSLSGCFIASCMYMVSGLVDGISRGVESASEPSRKNIVDHENISPGIDVSPLTISPFATSSVIARLVS